MIVDASNMHVLDAMRAAGAELAAMFEEFVPAWLREGATTRTVDLAIDAHLQRVGLVSQSKGYRGYRHASCISVNDVVVHGVPAEACRLQAGDLVTVDVCAAWKGACADMARCFVVPGASRNERVATLMSVTERALFAGIARATPGAHIGDISHAIQEVLAGAGLGIVRDFAGHGIGHRMHEDPEVPNFGKPGKGPRIVAGLCLAIEPMATLGSPRIVIDRDGWTARTRDGSWAAHIEDTIVVTDNGPEIVTRLQGKCA